MINARYDYKHSRYGRIHAQYDRIRTTYDKLHAQKLGDKHGTIGYTYNTIG